MRIWVRAYIHHRCHSTPQRCGLAIAGARIQTQYFFIPIFSCFFFEFPFIVVAVTIAAAAAAATVAFDIFHYACIALRAFHFEDKVFWVFWYMHSYVRWHGGVSFATYKTFPKQCSTPSKKKHHHITISYKCTQLFSREKKVRNFSMNFYTKLELLRTAPLMIKWGNSVKQLEQWRNNDVPNAFGYYKSDTDSHSYVWVNSRTIETICGHGGVYCMVKTGFRL